MKISERGDKNGKEKSKVNDKVNFIHKDKTIK